MCLNFILISLDKFYDIFENVIVLAGISFPYHRL